MPGFTAEASAYPSDGSYRPIGNHALRQPPESGPRDRVVLVGYDPRWPALFEVERGRIQSVLGPRAVAIEHIGSSAVPGLGGRPEIDILVGVRTDGDLEPSAELLGAIGYRVVARPVPQFEGWRVLTRPAAVPFGVLIAPYGSETWRRHLWFRHHLRLHPETARTYRRLKSEWKTKYRSDVEAYQRAKQRWVSSVQEARWNERS
jgi:GrpB-like predicted nucleotidyltransferase (UPF0157 family)